MDPRFSEGLEPADSSNDVSVNARPSSDGNEVTKDPTPVRSFNEPTEHTSSDVDLGYSGWNGI